MACVRDRVQKKDAPPYPTKCFSRGCSGTILQELFTELARNKVQTVSVVPDALTFGATPIFITVVIPFAEPTDPGVSCDRASAKCNHMLHTLRASASEVCLLGLLVPCISMYINKHMHTHLNMYIYIYK